MWQDAVHANNGHCPSIAEFRWLLIELMSIIHQLAAKKLRLIPSQRLWGYRWGYFGRDF